MNEVPLAQCNVCGAERHPNEIDWDIRYTLTDVGKVFLVGIVLGGFIRQLFMWI